MSDIEDETTFQNEGSMNEGENTEELGDLNREERGRNRDEHYEGEEDEEEEDYDEEDEVDGQRPTKKAKHRQKRPAAHRFIDFEAEVDEEEEEEEEEEDYVRDEFIAGGDVDEEDSARRTADHARFDRHERELDDQDLAQIASDLSKRYGGRRAAVPYAGDMNEVPQRLLMPSVHDASLWQVRVKPGRERDIVFSLMRKAIDLEYSPNPLKILSAFQRDSLPGMIYVEARSSQQVSQACNGLVGVYLSRGVLLVPIEEMAALLQIKKKDETVAPGNWVRFKRGKYQGDLAQVMDVSESGVIGLKFIPRIDLNPKDDSTVDGRKRKKAGTAGSGTMRPPQRFFNYEEVVKVYGRKSVTKRNHVYVFQNDTYKNGFVDKDAKLGALVLDNVNPTLDEITRFTRGQDGTENEGNVDLSAISEASKKAAISVLQPGDHVEVFEGEQSGLHGVVLEIAKDVVKILASGVEMEGQKVDIPARSVRKRFKPGDHVKVMAGQNADETGLVVSVADNVVTFLSDMSMQEISVFSKDLREAAEVGSGTNVVGNYELHDLVQLDLQTVGVIFKTERDTFRVLDQNGQVRLVQPHQISMRRDSNRAIATDSEGHELRINDNMKEVEGEGRKGRVLHIHQSFFAFLHNRDIVDNGGVFVTRARSLASVAPKGSIVKAAGTDLSKMNPAATGGMIGGMVGSGNMGRGPRDRHIGFLVMIIKGPHKGYVGTIKDTNGNIARVELHTNNKVVTVEKEKLHERRSDGTLVPLVGEGSGGSGTGPPRSFGGGRTANPYAQAGGRTPGWGASGRTPNPYASGDSRTPAWNASSRTPNPYAVDGGRTPAWNASSRTPNPYAADGGRTPAWNATSRTPNPYSQSAGGSNTWGGASPSGGGGGGGGGGGWASPARQSTWGVDSGDVGGWGGGRDGSTWNAPTPAAAPTPGFGTGAPTPYPTTPGAPTPAPYPVQNPYQAATPGDMSARTPAATTSSYEHRQNGPHSLREDWLKDFPNQRIVLEIKGSRGDGSHEAWDSGIHEGKRGYAGPVLTAGETTVEFIPLEDVGHEKLWLPLKYVVPVHPEDKGDLVVVLAGQRKGEVVRVDSYDRAQCVVINPDNSFAMDIPTDQLAKLHES